MEKNNEEKDNNKIFGWDKIGRQTKTTTQKSNGNSWTKTKSMSHTSKKKKEETESEQDTREEGLQTKGSDITSSLKKGW